MVLEKPLESPLDCKEIQPVHSKGDQSWDFFGRTDAGLPCSAPGDLPDPGTELVSLVSPELRGGFFTISVTWEAQNEIRVS